MPSVLPCGLRSLSALTVFFSVFQSFRALGACLGGCRFLNAHTACFLCLSLCSRLILGLVLPFQYSDCFSVPSIPVLPSVFDCVTVDSSVLSLLSCVFSVL
ncbi:hypothetical protein AVEN_202590-1 [Araneus ventricosus]|uniref:Uncharacterized protein n=1 Tax=Araneus ventricosus TaxID=182803 RepID=A0A4Y2QMQ8_ARAVE|nr:hypothetical protein AVEN_202590-1 [Araneus ventricosus]